MIKDCNSCKWNSDNKCENTNWKTGKNFEDKEKPECGFLSSFSTTPMGYEMKAVEPSKTKSSWAVEPTGEQ